VVSPAAATAPTGATPPTAGVVSPAAATAPTGATPPTAARAPETLDASAVTASDSFTQAAQKALEKDGAARGASRAAELAWKATRNNPANAEAWLTLGAAYDTLGNKAQAQNAYRSCARQASGPRVAECRSLAGLPPE
jgi:Flp pilus assembly protein TadD